MGWQDAPIVSNAPEGPPPVSEAWAGAPLADAAPEDAPPPPRKPARFTPEEQAQITAFTKVAKTPQELADFVAHLGEDRGITMGNADEIIAFRDAHRDAAGNISHDFRYPGDPDTRPTSFIQGAAEGGMHVLNNLARFAEWGVPKVVQGMTGVPAEQISQSARDISGALGMPGTVDAAEANQRQMDAARPVQGSGAGRFAGGVAATLPTLALPGGLFAQGATAGALQTDSRTPLGIGADAAISGVAGKLGGAVVNRIGRVVAPVLSGPLKTLVDAGVRLSPGQYMRGVAQNAAGRFGRGVASTLAAIEDKATSQPIVGDWINANRAGSSDQFVRGAVNRALKPLGLSLPDDVPTGHAAVLHAKTALKEAYTTALGNMRMVPDHQLMTEVNDLGQRLANGEIDEPHLRRFEQQVANIVTRRMGPQGMTGENFKTVISELGNKAKANLSSSVASEREYGGVLMELARMIKQAGLRSSSPEAGAALRAADEGYAHYVRIRGAAKTAVGGVFTPGQLDTAVRVADSSVGKGDTATGQALMQDYATAGRQMLPSKVADSGTAGRKATMNPIAWGVGAAGSIPYALAKLGTAAATRTPGRAATAVGTGIRHIAPTLGIAAPAAIHSAR